MANDIQKDAKNIQVFKEFVTAGLGIILVLSTIIVAFATLRYIGQDKLMEDAKSILILLLGPAGVVVGYYFGRVPADSLASQAQNRAISETARAKQVTAQAVAISDKVDGVHANVASMTGKHMDPSSLGTIAGELQHIRDELRALGTIETKI